MEKFILIDKYNKVYKFNEKFDLLKYGESLGSPIFLKLDLNINIDILAYHFINLEYCLLYINENIDVYLCNRIDKNRLDYINDISNNYKYKTIKYNFDMFDGILSLKEIVGDKEFSNLIKSII